MRSSINNIIWIILKAREDVKREYGNGGIKVKRPKSETWIIVETSQLIGNLLLLRPLDSPLGLAKWIRTWADFYTYMCPLAHPTSLRDERLLIPCAKPLPYLSGCVKFYIYIYIYICCVKLFVSWSYNTIPQPHLLNHIFNNLMPYFLHLYYNPIPYLLCVLKIYCLFSVKNRRYILF